MLKIHPQFGATAGQLVGTCTIMHLGFAARLAVLFGDSVLCAHHHHHHQPPTENRRNTGRIPCVTVLRVARRNRRMMMVIPIGLTYIHIRNMPMGLLGIEMAVLTCAARIHPFGPWVDGLEMEFLPRFLSFLLLSASCELWLLLRSLLFRKLTGYLLFIFILLFTTHLFRNTERDDLLRSMGTSSSSSVRLEVESQCKRCGPS